MKLPFSFLFLRAIPEVIGIFLVGMAVIKEYEKITLRNTLIFGLSGGIIVYFIRMLPVKFGIHSIISMIIYMFILNLYLSIELKKSITAMISAVALLAIGEWISITLMLKITGYDLNYMLSNDLLRLMFGLPSLAILYIFCFIKYKVDSNRNKRGLKNVD
ncbi:MAG: hypothetical protein PWP21_959 [Thermosediminibacterales bacterium]|nr:hypothetical protein [Thermosediminibacterales bacterium]